MSSSDDENPQAQAAPFVDENLSLPSVFWDHIPEGAEEHPDYMAMKALEEESTPEERADNFKVLSVSCVQLLATQTACQAVRVAPSLNGGMLARLLGTQFKIMGFYTIVNETLSCM